MLSRREFVRAALGLAAGTAAAQPRSPETGPRRRIIVDSQVHLWAEDSPNQPWVPGLKPQLPEPFTAERFLPMMQDAGVSRAIIATPAWVGDRNDYQLAVARRYPHRFAVMGRIALRDPKSARLLPGWRRQPGMLGIRVPFIGPAANWLADGSADWLWPAAERAGVPLMVLAPDQSAGFIPIAQRHSDLVLIIDHMGLIADNVAAGKLADAVDQTLMLAKFPNVSVKLSGVTNNSSQDYPYPEFTPHIKRLFEAYGRERCYWGSDLTNNLGKASYRQRVTHFTEQLPFLTETDKDWVMGRSILRRLRWE